MRVVREDDAVALAADVLLLAASRGQDVYLERVNSVRLVRLCALLLAELGTGRTEDGND
jgi:hypothetical protein